MINEFKRMADALGYTHEISETETEIIERVVRADGSTVVMARRNKSAEDNKPAVTYQREDDHKGPLTNGGTGGWIDASPFVRPDRGEADDVGDQSRCRNPKCKARLDRRATLCAGCRYACLVGMALGAIMTSVIVLFLMLFAND